MYSSSTTMEKGRLSRKRNWQQTQPHNVDPKVIEGKRVLRLAKGQSGLKAKIVFMYQESTNDKPFTIMTQNANALKLKMELKLVESEIKCNVPTWNFYIEDELVASGEYETVEQARDGLTVKAYDDFKRYCFTLIQKGRVGDTVTKNGSVEEIQTKPMEEDPKAGLSLGERMMAKMGWKGGGLGAQEQGIVKTVELQEQVDRRGLGGGNVLGKISNILADFAKTCSIKSLVFSKEYSKEERAHIHSLARKYNLHSKSYGKGDDRFLVVKCRLDRWHIVEQVIEQGGETNEYKLIYPTDL